MQVPKEYSRCSTKKFIKQSTVNSQQSTDNSQLSTVNRQQSTDNSQQSTVNSQQSTDNSQQTTVNSQQSTVNRQQSTINSQQTTVNNQQSTNHSQQSTINDQRSTITLFECVCFAVTLDPLHFAIRNGINLLFKIQRIFFFVAARYPHYAHVR